MYGFPIYPYGLKMIICPMQLYEFPIYIYTCLYINIEYVLGGKVKKRPCAQNRANNDLDYEGTMRRL